MDFLKYIQFDTDTIGHIRGLKLSIPKLLHHLATSAEKKSQTVLFYLFSTHLNVHFKHVFPIYKGMLPPMLSGVNTPTMMSLVNA